VNTTSTGFQLVENLCIVLNDSRKLKLCQILSVAVTIRVRAFPHHVEGTKSRLYWFLIKMQRIWEAQMTVPIYHIFVYIVGYIVSPSVSLSCFCLNSS
jgi:hypothetical protein